MAQWYQKVRAAEQFIQNVEECLRATCVNFQEVTLHPWRSSGGRSEGVAACFTFAPAKTWCVTIYEHWNTDKICIKFNEYTPPSQVISGDHHDVPDVELGYDRIEDANLIVQLFLIAAFQIELPRVMYVPYGWNGIGGEEGKVMARANFLRKEYEPTFTKILGLNKKVRQLREVNND